MVAIQHPVLKKQFEQFARLGSEGAEKAFWKTFAQNFEAMNEQEQEGMREAWLENVANIDKRLKEISRLLEEEAAAIEVFPASAEERRLVEALLSRMNIRFKPAARAAAF